MRDVPLTLFRERSTFSLVQSSSPRGNTQPPSDAVERAARVLLALAEADVGRVTEIARRVGLPKSTVHRMLASLTRAGLAMQDGDRSEYRLGPHAVSLGLSAIGTPDLRTRALPVMVELRELTAETVTLSLRVGFERLYIAQIESLQDVRMAVELGRRYPLYAGASGKAILAFLPPPQLDEYLSRTELEALTPATMTSVRALQDGLRQVRERGYASSQGERDPWAASVAAPIRDAAGRAIGSLSICGPLTRFDAERFAELGPLVVRAAHQLSSTAEPSA